MYKENLDAMLRGQRRNTEQTTLKLCRCLISMTNVWKKRAML